MRYRYSRQFATEENKNIRSAVTYVVLTIGALLLILFFGIPALGKFASFLHDLTSSNKPVESKDTTPPPPPTFENLPDVTKEINIEISGRTEPGAKVVLKVNDKDAEVIANSEGKFSYKWALWKGENKISGKSIDTSNNESQDSKTLSVIFDDKPPKLDIISPSNGSSFSGSGKRQVSIDGETEEQASVTINDRIVAVEADGTFSFFTTLVEGDNKFEVVAHDRAGNETKKSITLKFTP